MPEEEEAIDCTVGTCAIDGEAVAAAAVVAVVVVAAITDALALVASTMRASIWPPLKTFVFFGSCNCS